MNRTQKNKRNFRASKAWKEFRHKKHVEQCGMDPITQRKLRKGCNCHHLKLTSVEEEYRDLSNPDAFVVLNKSTHECIHFLYTYYKDDEKVLDRFAHYLDRMVELSGGKDEEVQEDLG